jgi:hypothetical protein
VGVGVGVGAPAKDALRDLLGLRSESLMLLCSITVDGTPLAMTAIMRSKQPGEAFLTCPGCLRSNIYPTLERLMPECVIRVRFMS